MKKTIRTAVCFLLCLCILQPAAVFAREPIEKCGGNVRVTYLTDDTAHDYTITDPYAGVDWNTWGQYKAALHCHTNASDGEPNIAQCVEEHYRLGFDILAISDHAVIGAPWDEVPRMVPLYRAFKFERTKLADPVVLTPERRAEILSGADRGGRGMLEITGVCEANGATPINDCHINTLWSSYGQAKMGLYGDYETVAAAVEKEGGLSFLDHTGEYVGCEDDEPRASEPYYCNKFANIFLDYPSCAAFDINSGKNNRTRYDADIWDNILQLTLPFGRNVPCITFSDGHLLDEYDRAFTMMLMPENTVEAFRSCLESGAWFSVGRFARKDLGEDFEGVGAPPRVDSVTVDNENDRVGFTGGEYTYIKWISDGQVIAEGTDCNFIDLNDFPDEAVGQYVRFQITGAGGILYSQAFPVASEDIVYEADVYVTRDFSYYLRKIVNILEFFFGKTLLVTVFREVFWGTHW